jgi:uncharacterized protein (TIGR02246 family)
MRKILTSAVVLTALFVAAPSRAGSSEDAMALLKTWTAAFNAGDLDGIVALYSPNATLFGTNAPTQTNGQDALRSYFGIPLNGHVQVAIHPDVVAMPLSPDQAVVSGLYDISGNNTDGRHFSVPGRFTFVMSRKDGALVIVHHHSSVRPAEK